jgi:hypothetical protein
MTYLLLNSVLSKLEIEWTAGLSTGIRWRTLDTCIDPIKRPRRGACVIMFLRRFVVMFQNY